MHALPAAAAAAVAVRAGSGLLCRARVEEAAHFDSVHQQCRAISCVYHTCTCMILVSSREESGRARRGGKEGESLLLQHTHTGGHISLSATNKGWGGSKIQTPASHAHVVITRVLHFPCPFVQPGTTASYATGCPVQRCPYAVGQGAAGAGGDLGGHTERLAKQGEMVTHPLYHSVLLNSPVVRHGPRRRCQGGFSLGCLVASPLVSPRGED